MLIFSVQQVYKVQGGLNVCTERSTKYVLKFITTESSYVQIILQYYCGFGIVLSRQETHVEVKQMESTKLDLLYT